MSSGDVKCLCRSVDSDNDGVISSQEFLTFVGYEGSPEQYRMSRLLLRVQDQGLSLESLFREWDVDGDLTVTGQELMEGIRKVFKEKEREKATATATPAAGAGGAEGGDAAGTSGAAGSGAGAGGGAGSGGGAGGAGGGGDVNVDVLLKMIPPTASISLSEFMSLAGT